MILLLGGTSDTVGIAMGLAQAGCNVLVSTATDEPLDTGQHARISRRCGKLDEAALSDLIRQQGIRAIVDATHPYAVVAHATARSVCGQLGIGYFRFLRPGGDWQGADVHVVADHEEAARLAFSFGRPVLLTTGANHVLPYAQQSRHCHIPLVVRVLPRPESRAACLAAGIAEPCIISAKGPFSVEENRAHIQSFHIGVLVTKDSGEAGGVPAKLAAGRQEACQIIMVRRPAESSEAAYDDAGELVAAVVSQM